MQQRIFPRFTHTRIHRSLTIDTTVSRGPFLPQQALASASVARSAVAQAKSSDQIQPKNTMQKTPIETALLRRVSTLFKRLAPAYATGQVNCREFGIWVAVLPPRRRTVHGSAETVIRITTCAQTQ